MSDSYNPMEKQYNSVRAGAGNGTTASAPRGSRNTTPPSAQDWYDKALTDHLKVPGNSV